MKKCEFTLSATSTGEPERLMRYILGAIEGSGGWVVCRHFHGACLLRVGFEFERRICVEIYAVLLASELALTPRSHQRMKEFCQCTYGLPERSRTELAAIELEVETYTVSNTLDLDPSRLNVA